MKRALGVSVYPDHSDINQDKAYLKKASECGFTRIFYEYVRSDRWQRSGSEKI
ncbi:hypothetical protein EB37_00388 [Enterococcus faecalis]|nr:hypothetical protein EB37_00388 [Enterococcus faecalis]